MITALLNRMTAWRDQRLLQSGKIPSYPPFQEGVPAVRPDLVVKSQQDLVKRLRRVLGLPAREHNQLIMPVLRNYASFVHLLPASESHHHRGMGGLFRHGLEVAIWAAQGADNRVFGIDQEPKERSRQEPRWRVAAAIAGMLHDTGKVISDIEVTDQGGKTWLPLYEPVHTWAERHKIRRYFLRWRSNRAKRHEDLSIASAEMILTPELQAWLADPNPEILRSALLAIGGDKESALGRIVQQSDQRSVQKDLRSGRGEAAASVGMPTERYIIDAARRLLDRGTWLENQKGARVWVHESGVYIVWRYAAEEIYQSLRSDGVRGIPRNHHTLADVLIERGFAEPKPAGEGEEPYRYWMIAPDCLTGKKGPIQLLALKLSSPEILYTDNEPPPATEITIPGVNAPEESQEKDSKDNKEDSEKEGTEAEKTDGQTDQKKQGEPDNQAGQSEEKTSQKTATPEQTVEPEPQGTQTANQENATEESQTDRQGTTDQADQDKQEQDNQDNQELEKIRARVASEGGVAGEVLLNMLKEVSQKIRRPQELFFDYDQNLIIRYPKPLSAYIKPMAMAEALKEQGWLIPDVTNPGRLACDFDGTKGLMLTEKVSADLHKLLEAAAPGAERSIHVPKEASESPSEEENSDEATNNQDEEKKGEEEEKASFVERLHQAFDRIESGEIKMPQVEKNGEQLKVPSSAIAKIAQDMNESPAEVRRTIEQHDDFEIHGIRMIRKTRSGGSG